MVAKGMADRDIDQAIMYSDNDVRQRIWHHVLELRTQSDPLTPLRMTPLQREKIPQIPAITAELKRSNGRTPAKSTVATKLEINRDTLDDWINAGLVRWPPEAAE
jgi:hypothetical protein